MKSGAFVFFRRKFRISFKQFLIHFCAPNRGRCDLWWQREKERKGPKVQKHFSPPPPGTSAPASSHSLVVSKPSHEAPLFACLSPPPQFGKFWFMIECPRTWNVSCSFHHFFGSAVDGGAGDSAKGRLSGAPKQIVVDKVLLDKSTHK